MMGLKTRLALARTLVWVGLQSTPEVLTGLVRELLGGRADLVVLVQPDATADDLLTGHRAALAASDGRAIIGLAADQKLAGRAGADLVAADAAAAQIRAHQYGLTLAVASDARELEGALASDQVDAVVVLPALAGLAIQLAPPAMPTSKPWFAQTETLAAGRELIAAGVRRLALEAPPLTAEQDLGMSPGAVVAAYRQALSASWRDEMQQVSLAGFSADGRAAAPTSPPARGLVEGHPRARQTPDAPQPDAPFDEWSRPEREKGPDDHW